MLPAGSIRSVQLQMQLIPLRLPYLRQTFERIGRLGFNTVLLHYGGAFPFRRRHLRDKFFYSRHDVRQIDRMAADQGLQVIPWTHSFSHADPLLKCSQYAHLAETDSRASLCLSNPESVELMGLLTEEMLELHPGAKFVHLGGDEIAQLIGCPTCATARWKRGHSGIFVDYLNRVAERLHRLRVRPAIWSDMLIRYPQKLDGLSRDYLIYYWDYWSTGERQPFLTIGGGLVDMFVLDKKAIDGDYAIQTLFPAVRTLEEMPQDLAKRYRSYWKLDRQRRTAKSFPYLQFFTDLRFDVVLAVLNHSDLGSILPNFRGKWSHLSHAVKRIHETGAAGGTLCYWPPHWPMFETLWLGIAAFAEGLQKRDMEPRASFKRYASLVFGEQADDFAKAVFNVSQRFELGDTLTPFWQVRPLREKIAWHRKAGLLAEEKTRVRHLRAGLVRYKKMFRKYAAKSPHARLFLILAEEMSLKLEYEDHLIADRSIPVALKKRFRNFAQILRREWKQYYLPHGIKTLEALRIAPFLVQRGRE